MRRYLLLAICVFATCLCFGAKENLWIGGIYSTSFEKQKEIEMILIQEGDKIRGSYDYENGKIEGELKGRKLTGRWTEDKASGRFEFEFSKDGKSFEGLRSHGDNAPDKKSPSWDGEQVKNSKKKSLRGAWVLVGKETVISRPNITFKQTTNYEDLSSDIASINYNLAGTAEDYSVRLTCDYHHPYTDGKHTYVDDIVFDVTSKGGFQPLEDYYLENSDVYCTFSHSMKGKFPKASDVLEIIPGYITAFPSNHLVYRENVRIEPGRYENVFNVTAQPDIVFGKDDVAVTVLGNEPAQALITFPYHKYNETPNGSPDDLYICLGIHFRIENYVYAKDKPYYDKADYIGTVYHYRWNGDSVGVISSSDPSTGWVRYIFDAWKHTNDLWTILISLGSTVLVIGALGGMFPEDSADESFPDEPDGKTPGDLSDEKKHRFVQDDDPDYVRRNVHENDDGSLTLTDPGGGPTQILYPKLDPEGNRIGWFNQNFTEYDDDDIREWTRWRSENAYVFQQDTAQAERNVAEQRAMNEARDEADRERGSTQTADEIKQWEKHQARLEKLSDRFGIDINDEKALKKAIKRDITLASIAGAKESGRAAWWDERIAEAEMTEKVCDTLIDAMGEISPQTKAIKEQYHFFKTIGQRTMEGIVDNKGTGHLMTKIGQGFAENAIDSFLGDNEKWEGTYFDSEKGRGAGAEVLKSVMGSIIEGDKEVSEIFDDAVKSGVTKYGSDLIGDVVGDQFKDAELTRGATEAHRDMMKSLYSSWFTQDISDPISEEISTELNEWRQFLFGI